MDVNPTGSGTPSIVDRAKAIILQPKAAWPVIEAETTPSGDIFTRYAVPLAAIGPVAQLIGSQLFGFSAFGVTYRPSLAGSLSAAIIGFILSLVGIFIISFITNKLAPKFGGQENSRAAFKLVVYSMTASWLAGIFGLIPSLAFLAIVGLYSFYLFYLGTGPLMKVPPEKALTYTIVTVLCVIVIYIIIASISAGVGRLVGGASYGSMEGGTVTSSNGESVAIPGIGTLDTAKLEAATKDMEKAQNHKAVEPATLQALLPASIGGFTRSSISSSKAGPASHAEAVYTTGDKSITLKVSDIAAMGAIAGMAGAFGVESNEENADGFERTSTVDGNLTTEKWNRSSNSGSYSTMIAKRFMIEAEGDAGSIDELKAATARIDTGKLATLANN